MEVQNTIIVNQNDIDQAIHTININKIVDDVVEKIESNSEEETSNKPIYHTNNSASAVEIKECSSEDAECSDVIEINIKKPKHSECTICTESVSDSSSEPESENFKCDVCSNHVHPVCMYNYGIYHELSDLNSIPCYVCEKGILRPNNSIGRKLRAIADRLRGTRTSNRHYTGNDNNLQEHLLHVSSPRRIRREILEDSGYFQDEQSNSYDSSNDSDDDSEVENINANSIRQQTEIRYQQRNNSYTEQIYSKLYCCVLILRGVCFFFILVIVIGVISGVHTTLFLKQ